MQYFGASHKSPSPKSSTVCVKSIPGVWRICARVGTVVQIHAGFYDALGKRVLPLAYLLNQHPPRVLLFRFVCAPKHLSHALSSEGALWLQQCPETFSTPLKKCSFITSLWSHRPKKFSSLAYSCCGAFTQDCIRGVQLGCVSCLVPLFPTVSTANALKRIHLK